MQFGSCHFYTFHFPEAIFVNLEAGWITFPLIKLYVCDWRQEGVVKDGGKDPLHVSVQDPRWEDECGQHIAYSQKKNHALNFEIILMHHFVYLFILQLFTDGKPKQLKLVSIGACIDTGMQSSVKNIYRSQSICIALRLLQSHNQQSPPFGSLKMSWQNA